MRVNWRASVAARARTGCHASARAEEAAERVKRRAFELPFLLALEARDIPRRGGHDQVAIALLAGIQAPAAPLAHLLDLAATDRANQRKRGRGIHRPLIVRARPAPD